jgi:pantetheine-phosphate adenylyltransferase
MCAAFPTARTVTNALVLATLPSLAVPYFLFPAITTAATAATDRLTIVLFSRLFNDHGAGTEHSHTAQWQLVHRLLTYIYVQVSKVAQDMDKILLDANVLLKGMDEELPASVIAGVDITYRVRGGTGTISCSPLTPAKSLLSDSIAAPLPLSLMDIPHYFMPNTFSPVPTPWAVDDMAEERSNLPGLFPVVALGGTFDHLHAGHKILLSMAAWIAGEKIIVGVTGSSFVLLSTESSTLAHHFSCH